MDEKNDLKMPEEEIQAGPPAEEDKPLDLMSIFLSQSNWGGPR
ncbi:MAG: hypothetical protein NT002_05960 [candidate division Zixibacteria bacterium]|nr:hypothetical protein [candidate division Zixibacteria bacterium]